MKNAKLIVFDAMVTDMLSNKKLDPLVNQLFIWGGKLNISLVFITQSYFAVPKNTRMNSSHYFIMTIPNKRELQETGFNHPSDADFNDFMKFLKKYIVKPYSFLVIDNIFALDNLLRLR